MNKKTNFLMALFSSISMASAIPAMSSTEGMIELSAGTSVQLEPFQKTVVSCKDAENELPRCRVEVVGEQPYMFYSIFLGDKYEPFATTKKFDVSELTELVKSLQSAGICR